MEYWTIQSLRYSERSGSIPIIAFHACYPQYGMATSHFHFHNSVELHVARCSARLFAPSGWADHQSILTSTCPLIRPSALNEY